MIAGSEKTQDDVVSSNAIRFKDVQKVVSVGDDDVEGELKDQILDMVAGDTLSITVVAGSGDLAKKKFFPALFALYYQGYLPKHFTVFGYARSKKIGRASCRERSVDLGGRRIIKKKTQDCEKIMDSFIKRVFYQAGAYDQVDGYRNLPSALQSEAQGHERPNRLF